MAVLFLMASINMCRVISTFITQGAFLALDAARAAAPGAWTVQSVGSGGSYLDGWEGGTERRDSSAAGSDVEHKQRNPPQSKTKEKNITCS